MSSALQLFHFALLLIVGGVHARRHPLPFFTEDNPEKIVLTSDTDKIPVDPYFTNGVQQVWREDGTKLFENTFGFKSRTYNVVMSAQNRFRVGSNSKLFTAVSIYQLHDKGVLDVNHNVADYVDQSDFTAFGFPNQTSWCPQIYEGDGSCQSITFVQLMSMSSGMVDGINCNYPPGSWELEYCQTYPTFQAYVGSIGAVVGGFINRPLSAPAGTTFHYTNENFILLSYLVEKLSGLSFREYLQTRILQVIGLQDTYYDPWQSSLGQMDPAMGDEYRDYHDMASNVEQWGDGSEDVSASYYASSVCSDEFNSGAFSGTGGMISTTSDMHSWYSSLFIDYNPALLTVSSINALIAPVMLTSTTSTYKSYFGQGVGTDVYIGETSPFVIYYTGGMYCATTSIRMLTATPTAPAIIAIAFRNNVIVNATSAEVQESLNSVTGSFYDIAYMDYEWPTYADSKTIVYLLASYFRIHPDDATTGSTSNKDNDEAEAVMIVIIVVCAVVALGLGGLFAFMLKPWKYFERRGDGGRSNRHSKSSRGGSLASPILEDDLEDEVF